MDREEALAQLDHVKRLRDRAEAAQKAATEATEPAIAAALEAEISPTEIAARVGVSDSHVRAVRRKRKLPANPSYAHLRPPQK
ncbi:MAG: hypothetical protein HOY79_17715 [Streptomyces sp.]|nr:hypothetical protein [Streptomyces sp.]